jgi:hypothetical protein
MTAGQPSDDAVERLGEALFVLSDRLRASGVLSASDPVHQAYEGVVAAFQPLAAMQSTETEAVIGELAEAVKTLGKCGSCGGSGRYLNRWITNDETTGKPKPMEEEVECRKCGGSGLNPIATAVLAKLKERGQC